MNVLQYASRLVVCLGTFTEALIVAGGRGAGATQRPSLRTLSFAVEPVSEAFAAPYARWGRGALPAALNFGDCFAYALAEQQHCPLLFISKDFARADVKRALSSG